MNLRTIIDAPHGASAVKRMLQGSIPALAVALFFIFSVDHPKPEWPSYWMIQPLIVLPFAGAMGGLAFYVLDFQRAKGGAQKWLTNIANFIIYVVGLWMGIVLGFHGTLWN